MLKIPARLRQYGYLMRLNKPIGIFLLLWPTLWALWLSSAGRPSGRLLAIFTLGVIVMRSAGCVINDLIDQHIDRQVARTRERPLAAGRLHAGEAVALFIILNALALWLVLQLNRFTLIYALIGAILTVSYPWLKRFTHLPQVGLGLAFTWGIPLAFAATTEKVTAGAWFLWITVVLWPIIYDTFYAMADQEDDLKAGVKSTAILFAPYTHQVLACLQILFLLGLIGVGLIFNLRLPYYGSLGVVALLFIYQQFLIKEHPAINGFKAFLNNNWVGAVIFVGIFLSYI